MDCLALDIHNVGKALINHPQFYHKWMYKPSKYGWCIFSLLTPSDMFDSQRLIMFLAAEKNLQSVDDFTISGLIESWISMGFH
jgi:hypothetical protein